MSVAASLIINNVMEVTHMRTDKSLQNNVQGFATENNEQKVNIIGPFKLKSQGKNFTEQQLTRAIVGAHVQNVINEMVDSINQNLIDKLNTILTDEEKKVAKLIEDVGDQKSGLVKDLSDLKQAFENIAPPLAAPPVSHVTGEENGLF
ncbi:hypothetical protein [Wolbachia endosymbiont of Armadillidium vulgare]|uniref:hypothetical protein n=1 Tax=Wolbachia endosymbiont of Armadillidium vulgare TaxID=77039 RepID=UPI00064AB7F9|nr:hypothetical protein [Wolbachia endosymbiont of Armadillidium vulgare]OJH31099.1 hypothetical protein Wxf_00473 [Wolbachia endosymbiont of Armadillidium vulgare]